MEVILGKRSGFCFGVTNAVEKTKQELKGLQHVYCLGELTHNNQVMMELKQMGLEVLGNLDNIYNSKVIIRAHGVEKQIYNQAIKQKIDLIDLTCPKVLNIHRLAEEYTKRGFYIFLIAEQDHPETVGTFSFCGDNKYLIQKPQDVEPAIEKLINANINNLLIISQTTFSLKKFDEIVQAITSKLNNNVNVVIEKSICRATELRQIETEEISREVELMIIIGGKNSSNTKKLYEISLKNCKNVLFIETVDELNITYIRKFNKIGIMAGASTPKKIIDEVEKRICKCI